MEIITNNVPRDIIYGYELTPEEREDFDYLDFGEDGDGTVRESARYKRELYDLGDFMAVDFRYSAPFGMVWDGYISDTFFSGILVRYVFEDGQPTEQVIMGRYYA